MNKKKIVAVMATVLSVIVGIVVIVSVVALSWWQWTIVFAVGLAVVFLWLHLTAEI